VDLSDVKSGKFTDFHYLAVALTGKNPDAFFTRRVCDTHYLARRLCTHLPLAFSKYRA